MKKLRVLISAILLFSLYSCMGDPFSPEDDSTSPVKALAYKENNSVMKYDVNTGTATTLFTPDTEEEIGGVAVDKSGNLYVSLYQSFATGNNDTYKNRVLRFTSAGMQSVVFQDSAITSLKITHMFTSPSGRYLLIYRYQYGDFELVCIDTEVKENNVFNSIFNRGRPVDYLDFTRLVWDEKNYRFYVMNDRNNVPKVAEFDLITGVYDKKDDPYIQLYVDSETLKSQGIIQEEFDFNKYTGDDFSVPKQIKFHPNSNAFLYMEGRELKCYNLDKGIFSTIMSSPAAQLPTYFFEDLEIIWDIDISPRDVSADLNQEYRYYEITDSVIATKEPLNTNINYGRLGTYSLPLLQVWWQD